MSMTHIARHIFALRRQVFDLTQSRKGAENLFLFFIGCSLCVFAPLR